MFAVLEFWDFLTILAIVTFAVSGLSVYLKPRDSGRLTRLEGKVDLLLQHAGLKYAPQADVSEVVRQALTRGNKIEAIRLYREETGAGLKEAKDAVEALEARGV